MVCGVARTWLPAIRNFLNSTMIPAAEMLARTLERLSDDTPQRAPCWRAVRMSMTRWRPRGLPMSSQRRLCCVTRKAKSPACSRAPLIHLVVVQPRLESGM